MYRNLELAKALSAIPVLKEIDELKAQLDALRPLPREIEERVMQKFRLDWNYHSNAIEGNPYTYGETVAFFMEGITAKGKRLKDHLDLKGHDDVIRYLLSIIKDQNYKFTEAEIRSLHKMLLKDPYFSDAVTPDGKKFSKEIKIGTYKSTPNQVETPTGAIHYYTSPEETPIEMSELMAWFNGVKDNSEIHPVVIAALFHHQFAAIHPFDDGNGRMARLLMNLILMQRGFPPVVIKQQDRSNYYQVLRRADVGEHSPFVEYIGDLLFHSLSVYLKGARGESIEETEDIDKEIALFKKSFSDDKINVRKNTEVVQDAVKNSIIPLFDKLKKKIWLLNDLFVQIDARIIYKTPNFSSYFHELNVSDLSLIDDIQELRIYFQFKNFKKTDPPIDYSIVLESKFDEFHYRILNSGLLDMDYKIKYGDSLSVHEINDIVVKILGRIMGDLKDIYFNGQEKAS